VAAGKEPLAMLSNARSGVIVNSHEELPPSFIRDRDFTFPGATLLTTLVAAAWPDAFAALDATRLAAGLLGDSIGANVLMLGFAFQRGQLPVSGAALYRALELYGRNVEENKLAFDWGRFAAVNREEVERLAIGAEGAELAPRPLPERIARREAFLVDYQDRAYAQRYTQALARLAAVEQRVKPGSTTLQEAVARSYFALLAFKDEYEVARLHTQTEFVANVRRTFGDGVRMSFNLSPPLLSRIDTATGRPRKYELGPWFTPVLKMLARVRRIRGTWFDPFAHTADRRLDRELLARYEQVLERVLAEIDESRFDVALEFLRLPEQVRGYGPIKRAAAERAWHSADELWRRWVQAQPSRREPT
jgi:indolepyruvate ferredoxin oxidoreductase